MAPLSVLIVDDDDVDRERLRRLLAGASQPPHTEEASSVQSAKALIAGTAFDCVFLDYKLGDGVSGLDLLADVKRMSPRPCPVVMVTGRGDERVAVEAMRSGVYEYLPKSRLHPQQLQTTLEGCLRWSELERRFGETQERMRRLSFFDDLTGLPNRNLFFDRLEQSVLSNGRGGPPFGVLMMDLDMFKGVNDRLGHQAGDELLKQVGRRLQDAIRRSDTVARLGGDEFAALLIGTDTTQGTLTTAHEIVTALAQPFAIADEVVSVGVSIGAALFPSDGRDANTLLGHADGAMYRAKRRASGCEMHDEGGTGRSLRSMMTANRLPYAIERGELVMHYQPKVNLRTHALVGVEALVRWWDPDRGLVQPAEFVPAAERSAAIGPLTYATLDMALDQAREWVQVGWKLPIAVNLSPRMFDDSTLAERITKAIASRHLDPESVTLELTETALTSSPVQATAVLQRLADSGVRISIDDFGAGFTSFRYLRDFAISEIKIDGMFVRDVRENSRDASIIHSIASLAEGFNISVVAECVEAAESHDLLRRLGCELGQGFSIGMPMRADQLTDWYQGWQARSIA